MNAQARASHHPSPGNQGGKAKWSKETYIALLAMLGILAHLIGRYGFHAVPRQYNWPLVLTLLIGVAPLLFDLVRRMVRGEFGADLLAGVSIAASVALGEYLAGSIVVLMLSGGTALEHYATRRASTVLAALAKRMPRTAHKLTSLEIADINPMRCANSCKHACLVSATWMMRIQAAVLFELSAIRQWRDRHAAVSSRNDRSRSLSVNDSLGVGLCPVRAAKRELPPHAGLDLTGRRTSGRGG